MNEILFRGIRKDNGDLVYGFYAKSPKGNVYITETSVNGTAIPMVVEPESVGQYIGLQDKDGKKAFTGDISVDLSGRFWVLFDCAGGFGTCTLSEWMKRDRTNCFLYEGLSDPQNASWFSENHKVVGSIHDRDLREFMGCDRSADDYVRAREILKNRNSYEDSLDSVIQACEKISKCGGKEAVSPSVERVR